MGDTRVSLTTVPDQRSEGRTLAVALVLSLLVHLLGFLAYFHGSKLLALVHVPQPRPTSTPEFVTTSEAITIEHRAHPVPVPRPHRPMPPPQRPVARVAPAPPVPPLAKPIVIPTLPPPKPPKAELTKPAPKANVAPTPAPSPKTVAQAPSRPLREQPPNPNHLSRAQVAQLEQHFSQTIAQVRSETNPLRVVPATPSAPKRYKMQFEGHFGTLHGGEGEYWPGPVQSWNDHGNTCYYMVYDYLYDSGGYEHGNVPWPVCFAPNRDPFANGEIGRLRNTPLPPPPPGWKLPPGAQVGKVLRDYLTGDAPPHG